MTRPRRWLLLVPAVVLCLLLAAPAAAHRCGKYTVIAGEPKFTVLEKCGEPEWREVVGWYYATETVELPIEEFWYATPNGVYHVLTFYGPELRDERSVRRP